MSDRERVEQQIGEILATETNAIALSDKLFRPDGLFNKLAKTEEERRLVAQSPLFVQAQRRLTELQRSEAAKFASAVAQAQAVMSEGGFLLKLERAESLERSDV
jgi:hypothetical protein